MSALVMAAAAAVASALLVVTSAENSTLHNAQRALGTPCMDSWDCGSVQFAVCQNGVCACAQGYITHAQEGRCLIHTNEECPATTPASTLCADPRAGCVQEPHQYPSGWWGTAFYCRCNEGFLHHAQTDQCRRALGYTCDQDIPCVTGECNGVTNLCSCSGFNVPNTDGLSCGAGLGAICSAVACADDNAECVNSICVCAVDYQTSSRPTDERPNCRKRLGASCEQSDECAAEEATCMDKKLRVQGVRACVCGEGHVPSTGLDSCLPVQGVYGGQCSIAAQCTAWLGRHSSCAGTGCACAANYEYDWRASACVRQ